jgi:GntR family transcriptional regulator
MDPITRRLADLLAATPSEPAAHLVVEEIWLAVVEGSLETGARLPTTRQLAIDLGVSPRSIERAYQDLERRGVVATRRGEGVFVVLAPPPEAELVRQREFAELCRATVERAEDLGFGVDDLLDALAEFRTARRDPPTT